MGYDVPNNHENLVNLNPQAREQAQKELRNKLKYNGGMYMHRAMKKVGERGCILAAHQFV
jgi:hypothetical protein